MSINLKITNFRALKNVHLVDEDPIRLSIVLGYNEAGKTSLRHAIRFAATGEALGYKGASVDKLVTYGESSLKVDLRCGDFAVGRTTSRGDTLKSIAGQLSVAQDVLPLLFDPSYCGDAGSRAMKAFLSSVGPAAYDPLAAFAADRSVLPYLEACHRAGKKDVKQMVSFMEGMRAAAKPPAMPTMPSIAEPSLSALQAQGDLVEGIRAELQGIAAKLADVSQTAQGLAAVLAHRADHERYQAQLRTANDPLAGRRRHLEALIAAATDRPLQALQKALEAPHGLTVPPALSVALRDLTAALTAVRTMASDTLAQSPPPAAAIPPTPLVGHTAEVASQTQSVTPEALQAMIQRLQPLEAELRAAHAAAAQKLETQKQLLGAMHQQRGIWDAFNAARASYDQQVQEKERDWHAWDHAIKSLQAAEAAWLTATGDRFGALVSEISEGILGGRRIRIDQEAGILLGETPILDASTATRWRIEAAIHAAVALYVKSPLLLLDGADILDVRNRATVTSFLLEHIVPRFTHVILTATPSGRIEDEQPSRFPQASKWILSNGSVKRL